MVRSAAQKQAQSSNGCKGVPPFAKACSAKAYTANTKEAAAEVLETESIACQQAVIAQSSPVIVKADRYHEMLRAAPMDDDQGP